MQLLFVFTMTFDGLFIYKQHNCTHPSLYLPGNDGVVEDLAQTLSPTPFPNKHPSATKMEVRDTLFNCAAINDPSYFEHFMYYETMNYLNPLLLHTFNKTLTGPEQTRTSQWFIHFSFSSYDTHTVPHAPSNIFAHTWPLHSTGRACAPGTGSVIPHVHSL